MNRILTTLACLALATGLSACSDAEPSRNSTSTGSPAPTSSPATAQAGPLAVSGAWSKATTADMTGVFATLTNTTDQPVEIVSATSPIAGEVQLHVTEKDASGAMVMKQSAGGFTVPPKGTLALAPGGNHIMLMALRAPVESGIEVPVLLTFADGSTAQLVAPARAYSGAKETYAPAATATGHAPQAPHGTATTTARS